MNAKENPVINPPAADSPEEQQSAAVIAVARQDEGQPAIPEILPILPIRNLVVFPGTVVPLTIGRATSRKLLEDSFAQRSPEQDNPGPEGLYRVGVAGLVLKLLRQTPDSIMIVVQALKRIAIRRVLISAPYLRAEVDVLAPTPSAIDAWRRSTASRRRRTPTWVRRTQKRRAWPSSSPGGSRSGPSRSRSSWRCAPSAAACVGSPN